MKKAFFTPAALARIAVLSAIASVLYFIPGIPIVPPIYKLDFSGVPVLLGGFAMGPVAALMIQLIKDLIGLTFTSSAGVGELADFLMTGSFALAASLVYGRMKTRKGALLGMLLGIVAIVVMGAVTNLYIMIPFYMGAFSMTEEAIVGMIAGAIPMVDSMTKLILLATVPFNLIKGVVLCAVTYLLYKPLSPLLHGKRS